MSILVTGGAGYIGSHTVVRLLETGEDVVIVDNFINSKPQTLESIKTITEKSFMFYEADICDKTALDRIFTDNKIEAVIHFAGLKAVGESVEKPLAYYSNNLTGTLMLLQVMKKHSCKKIVFSSSATVYGNDNPVPFIEEMKTSATNPYGWTKVMIEHILEGVCVSDDEFCAVLLRYFNPIGAHKSGLIGEEPNGIPNNLMPYIMGVAQGKYPYLRVFGDDYPTPDGTGVRDYIHVLDLADGHLAALEYARRNRGAQPINLGTGKGCSVLELASAFEKVTGLKIEKKILERRPGDIAECYADASKAKKLLNWEAVRGIDEMCEDSARFALKK